MLLNRVYPKTSKIALQTPKKLSLSEMPTESIKLQPLKPLFQEPSSMPHSISKPATNGQSKVMKTGTINKRITKQVLKEQDGFISYWGID